MESYVRALALQRGRGEDSSQRLLRSEATNLKAVYPRPRGLGFYPERAPYFVAFSTPIEHQSSEETNSSCKLETKMTGIYPSSDLSPRESKHQRNSSCCLLQGFRKAGCFGMVLMGTFYSGIGEGSGGCKKKEIEGYIAQVPTKRNTLGIFLGTLGIFFFKRNTWRIARVHLRTYI